MPTPLAQDCLRACQEQIEALLESSLRQAQQQNLDPKAAEEEEEEEGGGPGLLRPRRARREHLRRRGGEGGRPESALAPSRGRPPSLTVLVFFLCSFSLPSLT